MEIIFLLIDHRDNPAGPLVFGDQIIDFPEILIRLDLIAKHPVVFVENVQGQRFHIIL